MTALAFELPRDLSARRPPTRRDAVRMLVANGRGGPLVDTGFASFPDFLEPGDLVVVNASATLPAAIPVLASQLVLHLSTPVPGGPRTAGSSSSATASSPHRASVDGCTFETAGRRPRGRPRAVPRRSPPLGRGPPSCRNRSCAYLARHGRPIRYEYVPADAGRSPTTRPCSRPSRAAPRCRAPAGRSPPSSSPASSQRGRGRADRAAHGGLVARGRRAAVSGAVPGAGRHGAARRRDPRGRRAA